MELFLSQLNRKFDLFFRMENTMFKMFSPILFALFAMVVTQVYAQQVNLKLNPKASKVVTNHYSWTLEANCTIQANQAKNKILVSVLKNKGRVNGRNLANGQATSLVVHNNDNISVSAEPGAQVNLLNLGTSPVQAVCST